MVAWLGTGLPPLAHSIGEQAKVVISGRSVLASSSTAVRSQFTDCDPLEPTRCVLLSNHDDQPPSKSRF